MKLWMLTVSAGLVLGGATGSADDQPPDVLNVHSVLESHKTQRAHLLPIKRASLDGECSGPHGVLSAEGSRDLLDAEE